MTAVLQKILTHIYVRSPLEWMYLAIFSGLIFNTLWHRFGRRHWWRPCCGLMLGIWICAVLWTTVFSRQSSSVCQIQGIPLYTYWRLLTGSNPELLRSAFMNMLLFFPGGLLCAGLIAQESRSSRSSIISILLFGLFSFGIELTQGILQLGTLEIDDVLHNILGAAAGFVIFRVDVNDPQ